MRRVQGAIGPRQVSRGIWLLVPEDGTGAPNPHAICAKDEKRDSGYGFLHPATSGGMDLAHKPLPKQTKVASLTSSSGLQAVLIEEREEFLRFLRARGAGDGAEDILQDAWLRLAALPTTPIADPRSYVFRALNNVMVDRFRSAQRSRRRDAEWLDVAAGEDGRSDAPLPDRVLIARSALSEAEAALQAEGPRVLEIFRLFRLSGMTQRAIARQLGLSLSTVEKDLQKAYRTLTLLKERQDAE